MKAVVLVKHGSPEEAFELREVPEPTVGPSQVLVTAEGFGLNFADVMARNGLYREAPPTPCVLGYEVVGRIEKVGDKVSDSLLGKRVLAFSRFGGYAEKVAADQRGVVEIPEDLPLVKAAAMGTQYATAYYSIIHSQTLLKDDWVLIHAAAGGVGLALGQFAKHLGCRVIGTVGSDEKCDFLRQNGVQHVVNYRSENYSTAVDKILNGQRLAASFNAISGKTIKKDFKLLGSGGALVCFGAASRMGKSGGIFANISLLLSTGFLSPLFMMMQSKSLIGVNMLKLADNRPELIQHCLQNVVDMVQSQKINPHTGTTFPVSDIAVAHRKLEDRSSIGKIAVHW